MANIVKTINEYMIEQGLYFTAEHLFTSVLSDAYVYLRITNPSTDKYVHVQFNVNNEKKLYVASFSGTTYSNNGTAVTMFNRNSASSNTPSALVYHTPTINVLGTQRGNSMIAINSDQYVQIGGAPSSYVETVIAPSNDILIRLQNKGGTTQDIAITVNWYEGQVI